MCPTGRNDHQAAMTNIEALNVINDCAERGVKLSADFLSTTKTEKHYQNVLQVVEEDRCRQSILEYVYYPSMLLYSLRTTLQYFNLLANIFYSI